MNTVVDPEKEKSPSLLSLFWIFLKIGCTSFGGFMALVSVVENMIVRKRKLLKNDDLLDGISLATMLPGPMAVNVVTYVGYRIGGAWGALTCASAVIIPSFLLMVGLAVVYIHWGTLPVMAKLFMGFVPAVSAIILKTAWDMSNKVIKNVQQCGLLVVSACLLLSIQGFSVTLGIIVGAALFGLAFLTPDKGKFAGTKPSSSSDKPRTPGKILSLLPVGFFYLDPTLIMKLFVTFSGMSLMLFGGGYVMVPLMERIVVVSQGWVNQQEFIDAIALGQITPGPILISATFIGYKVAGFFGALSATVGIFLPSSIVMVFCSKGLVRIKSSPKIQSMLLGIRPAVIGMIFSAVYFIGRSAEMHWGSLFIFGLTFIAMKWLKIEVVWIIPSAGLLGMIIY